MISSPSQLIRFLLHLFFPRTCVCCGCDLSWTNENYLCPSCSKGLTRPGPLFCQRCGVNLPSGGAHCRSCRGSKAKQYKCQVIRSAWIFNTSSRALVHGLKYAYGDYLAKMMGWQMAKNFSRYPELACVEIIVPVPLFVKKERQRGYNQSVLLASSFAQNTGIPLVEKALVRTRDTVSQTTLGRQARLANMADAFSCVQPDVVKGKTILLIDDVATTGATLEGCAVALKTAGAKRVFAYTYAREN
ncbi:MAG: ComF family protein [Elusimicrobiaceae bacterium]|nr:ComF family protein [Elusimicrobiaceae bacterium]